MAAFQRIQIANRIIETGLIVLFTHDDADILLKSINSIYKGGSRLFEFTNRGECAINNFRIIQEHYHNKCKDIIIGVGSIMDPYTAGIYISEGANFIISPIFNSEIAKLCNKLHILYIPGCLTPSEISLAEEYGCEFVKYFPGASMNGQEFVRSVLAPMPWVRFIPTGGVKTNFESLNNWFSAGVEAVGLGSDLFKEEWIINNRFEEIQELTKTTLNWIKEIRNKISRDK